MSKKKIIHFHCDPKFVFETKRYSEKYFENELIFLGNPKELHEDYRVIAKYLQTEEYTDSKLEAICKDADLIVLNGLLPKILPLVKKIPNEKKVIWRFFGGEIYSREPQLVYSKHSLQTINNEKKSISFLLKLKTKIYKILHPQDMLKLAIARADYFMGVIDDEYKLLKSLGYNLPPFLQVPFLSDNNEYTYHTKSKTIIFGNSKNRFNNHLDVLELLQKLDLSDKKLTFKMFFSYGSNPDYEKIVREKAKEIPRIDIIEDFLSMEEFRQIYKDSAAMLNNSYRQLALGNIFTAIRNGVKVYLSEKNITYHWFLKNGIQVYSIEKNFYDDLIKDRIFLDEKVAYSNINNLKKMIKLNSEEKFNNDLIRIINNVGKYK